MILPKDCIIQILEWDGRIKYRTGKYINCIHKSDPRYAIIEPIFNKKKTIMKETDLHGTRFYFEFGFDVDRRVGLCYDYNWSQHDVFEICYYDMRNDGWYQIRTYL